MQTTADEITALHTQISRIQRTSFDGYRFRNDANGPEGEVIDCLYATLNATDPEDALSAAEDLVDAATRLRDRMDAEMMETAQ